MSPEAGYLLEAKDIYKSFAGVHALAGVSMAIAPGEIHCLAGENGCGKSTLIKVISGVYQPDAGSIVLGGQEYAKLSPIEAIRGGVQVIYQDFSIFPNLTVMENLSYNTELAARRKFVSWKRLRTIAKEALSKIELNLDLDARVDTLSVAQKQMIAICRALLLGARLIIMDEPTTALTRKEVDALFRIILDLKSQGIAVLFVSHKLNEVFEISERYTILRNGELVASGDTRDLNGAQFTYHMTGRSFSDTPFEPKSLGDIALEAKELSLAGRLDNVSFTLRKGEILGVTGLLDSGRTDLALALIGAKPADSGKLFVCGRDVTPRSPREAVAAKIGYVPEDRLSEGLFLPRSIGDNIVISEIDRLAALGGILRGNEVKSEASRWVGEMAIATPDPRNAASTLSGGNQQRVVLAKWLACDLDVLILNGPTVGVDVGSKHDIHQILRGLSDKGMAILIISDDLPELLVCCSRILVMKAGRVVLEAKPSESDEQTLLKAMM
jgi:simple sugar transport system ATP-binding protein